MDYPRFVFKVGGPFQMASGTYDRLLVQDKDESGEAMENGWFGNLQDAIDAKNAPVKKEQAADDAPPTRAELEAKATELGIKFDARFGDKKLSDLIQKALEG